MSFSSVCQPEDEPKKQPSPSPSLISRGSSFRSFDVRIWEELHLKSLSSRSTNVQERNSQAECSRSSKPDKKDNSKATNQAGFSFPYFPAVLRSGVASPHRLSSASNVSGNAKRENVPPAYNLDQLPVVKVIQTGRMSFTSEELVVQVGNGGTDDILLRQRLENMSISEDESCTTFESRHLLSESTCGSHLQAFGLGTVKFLNSSSNDVYAEPISPLKTPGSIPFKWEEAPGKPKPCTELVRTMSTPSLRLPPKLQYSSSYSAGTYPGNCSRNGSKNSSSNFTCRCSRSGSKNASCSTQSSSVDDTASKPTIAKSIWHSIKQTGRRSCRESRKSTKNRHLADEDPWSPTSILLGVDTGLCSSSSDSSTQDTSLIQEVSSSHDTSLMQDNSNQCESLSLEALSTNDVHCRCLVLADVQSARSQHGSDALTCHSVCNSNSSSCEGSSLLGYTASNVVDDSEVSQRRTSRLRRFLKSFPKWKLGSTHSKNHKESERWSPTLLTYIKNLDLRRSSSASRQSLLADEHTMNLNNNTNPDNLIICPIPTTSLIAPESPRDFVESNVHNHYLTAASSTEESDMNHLQHPLKKAKIKKKAGVWFLKKLRRSSKCLITVCRVLGNSRTRKRPRRRIPYQHIVF